MLILLASGKLIRDPIRRTSSAGKPYATALLSVPTDDNPTLVSCVAFSTAAEKLLTHHQGDTLSMLGKGRLSSWERNGEAKHGLDMVIDKLLSPYDLSKRRDTASEPPRAKTAQPAVPEPAVPEPAFDDSDLPF